MMTCRITLLAGAAFLVTGCIETTTPAFDASNATPVAEQAKFVAYTDFLDEAGPRAGGDPNDSPKSLMESGAYAVDLGDMVLVQAEKEGKFSYIAFGVLGGRGFSCMAAPDDETKAAAAAYGVTLVENNQGGLGDSVQVEGDKAKVAKFIRDQIETGPLVCFAVAKERRFAPE